MVKVSAKRIAERSAEAFALGSEAFALRSEAFALRPADASAGRSAKG